MLVHRSIARLAAAAAGATVVALSLAPAAQARTVDHDDHTRDVRSVALDDEDSTLTPAPRHRDGDIATVRISNGTVVGIRATYVDLRRTSGYRVDILKIVTNERVVRNVYITSGPGYYNGTVEVTRANGEQVACRVTHSVDYGTNVMAIHVPRPCLSAPRSVRVGLITASLTHDYRLLFLDDALRDHTASLNGTPLLSDRVWLH